MAFDITSVLKNVPVPGTGEEQIEYIDLDLIDPDPENFYSLDGLDDLAANIELIGLQQPLRVRPGEGSHVIVVSGHRRRAACLMLRDGGNEKFNRVACIREKAEVSAAMRELRLIYANASTRVMSPAEMSKQAERVETLLYQLKEEGVEFPGRMRDHVAQACKVSKSKLSRLHAIRNKLDPVFLGFFDRGELNEEAAYQLSRLPKDIQTEAAQRILDGRQKKLPTANVVEKVNKHLDKYLEPFPCRSHAGGPPCHHLNGKILRSIFAPYDWQVCDPGTCCRDCYHAKDCSKACQECKDRRKLEKDVEKEKEQERKKAESIQQENYRTARKKQAKRVLPLIEAKGLDDDTKLPLRYGYQKITPSKLKKIAAGDFGDEHYYDSELLPTDINQLTVWADKLDCSLDYLAGRSKDPKPVTGWQTGTPKEVGIYVIKAGYPAKETDGCTMRAIKFWNGSCWTDERTHAPLAGMNVYRWLRLPPEV